MDAFFGFFILIPTVGMTLLFSTMAADFGAYNEKHGVGLFYRKLLMTRPVNKTSRQLQNFVAALEAGKFDDVVFDFKSLEALIKAHELTDNFFNHSEYNYRSYGQDHSIKDNLVAAIKAEQKHQTEPSPEFTNELLGFLITYHAWRDQLVFMTTATEKEAWKTELPQLRSATVYIREKSEEDYQNALKVAKESYSSRKAISGGAR